MRAPGWQVERWPCDIEADTWRVVYDERNWVSVRTEDEADAAWHALTSFVPVLAEGAR